jgi:hypothetical protein
VTTDTTTKSPLENYLFRLCIVLKVVFWAALMAMLLKGMWATATGRELADPATLLLIVGALAGLQAGVWVAWWRVRRARLRRNAL